MEHNECCVCYEITKHKINCNHYVCLDCTDRMITNKKLCPYCRQDRKDICEYCDDRYLLCVCSIKYLFNNYKYSLREKFWIIAKVTPYYEIIINDSLYIDLVNELITHYISLIKDDYIPIDILIEFNHMD